jgi:hypothetical protein
MDDFFILPRNTPVGSQACSNSEAIEAHFEISRGIAIVCQNQQ